MKICYYWNCNIRIPNNHFLCPEHYEEWQDNLIDKCPGCGRYKDEEYELCLECYNKKANMIRGNTYIDNKGYKRFRDSGELVHRAVMRKRLGHVIPADMVVHHKNEDKTDFSRNNLQLMTRKEHFKHHVVKKKQGSL